MLFLGIYCVVEEHNLNLDFYKGHGELPPCPTFQVCRIEICFWKASILVVYWFSTFWENGIKSLGRSNLSTGCRFTNLEWIRPNMFQSQRHWWWEWQQTLVGFHMKINEWRPNRIWNMVGRHIRVTTWIPEYNLSYDIWCEYGGSFRVNIDF